MVKMADKRPDTKRKILDAAADIARDHGPGNLSLEAVAAKAGVSKGGLLYHFPSKDKLLEAVVEGFVKSFDQMLRERQQKKNDGPDSLVQAYLELFVEENDCRKPPPSALLAALAENPEFLAPVRRYHRSFLDRVKENAGDPAMAMVVFLAIEGLRSTHLLNIDVMSVSEIDDVVGRLKGLFEAA